MKGAIVGCLLAAVLAGCVEKNTMVENEKAVFVVGQTTRREVVSQWGNPDSVHGNVWGWKDWRLLGGKLKLGYMGVGFTVSRTEMVTGEYLLTFDEKGVLLAREVRECRVGGPVWSLDPEK